ncbi:hypothetical protein VdG1_02351 [Verticillium dahliae VDG1]|nr:hypothetical protein VdG1_02351 [Verticillium dahliae VDG1]
MFELPEAKRVRREDLLDSASDGSDVDEDDQHHAALRARLEAQLTSAFTFAPIDTPPSARAPAPAADQDSDGEAHRASSATGLREDGKRKRPGQKKRLAMRTREREAKKKAEEAEKLKTSKEEQLREKKKRLNRQRKLKRRAKAKEERAAAGLPSDHGGSSSEGDD